MQKYKFFNTSEIKPTGWLKNQLEIQANGLSGNLDKVWPDIRDSRWIGGTCEGWERVPYWLDGFIPLAYLLEDEDKIARAKKYIDAIVESQCDDGWICPCTEEERPKYDMWALYLIDKVLMLYYECSGDVRIPPVVYNSLKSLKAHVEKYPIFDWAHARWYECLIPIFAIYDIYHEEWLLELGKILREQGMDYEENYAGGDDWKFREPLNKWGFDNHVVNQAMAIKSGALSNLLDNYGSEIYPDDSFSKYMVSQLFKFHGTAVGHFTGDECLSGDSPIQGAELCSVVEAMYSYEYLYALTGNTMWADMIEKLAYNALPATISPDMWTHQYDQMINQVACVRLEEDKVIFRTNNYEAHLFGLEPHFGCCTANFNQGFPKLTLSTFLKSKDGVAVSAIAPAKLTTQLNGSKVSIESDTIYPFGNAANYIVETENDTEFTLTLRIPSCAISAKLDGQNVEPGTTIDIKRVWSGKTTLNLQFEFDIKYVSRPRNMFVIERGPLVYSLKIGEEKTMLEYTRGYAERKFPYCDYEIRPTTDWQYAFAKGEVAVHEVCELSDMPFSPENAPISLDVPVYPINWGWEVGYNMIARLTPESITPTGDKQTVTFIPYGCTNIRITEIPFSE